MSFNGYPGANPLSIALPGCGGNGAFGVQSNDCNIGLIQNIQYVLTPAQVLTMFTTPVVLVPAPGAGLSIIVDYAAVKISYGGTAYTGGGVVTIGYVGGAAVVPTMTAAQITVSANTTYIMQATSGTTTALTINAGIQITNATGVFATGNSPITVNISYIIL